MVARPGIAETKRPGEAPKGIFIESSADQLLNSGELAPHPVEFLLHGIAASVTESVARMALLRGVSIDGIESRAEARFTRSLLNGELMDCEQVQVKVAIQSDASAETVQDMFIAAVERAPVFSVFGGQAPVIFGLV